MGEERQRKEREEAAGKNKTGCGPEALIPQGLAMGIGGTIYLLCSDIDRSTFIIGSTLTCIASLAIGAVMLGKKKGNN